MKKYLKLLKELLMKNKNVYLQKDKNNSEKIDVNSLVTDESIKIIDIANSLGLEFMIHDLEKLPAKSGWDGTNPYVINDNNMIFFYPINDGMPTCPFEFWKNDKLIIDNRSVYSEITNLDELILQMVEIFDKSLDEGFVIDPYYFMLKLNDEIKENYHGTASLVITEKAIRNHILNEANFEDANQYFINEFLDHFIGWNFGLSVNRNEILEKKLIKLNDKVIKLGIRKKAGCGFNVYGNDDFVNNGLQHYHLPESKTCMKIKSKDK